MRSPMLLIVLILALILGSCTSRNHPPVIESFTASKARIFVGEEVVLRAEVYDPEDHPLTISWATDEGSFASIRGMQAVWTSSVPGVHTVEVEVADPYEGRVRASLQVQVDDHIALPAGTKVTMELLRDVHGDLVRIGDVVPLRVVESVSIEGFEVISTGAYGVGQVLYVQLPTNGSEGRMVLAPSKVQLTDGRIVNLLGVRNFSRVDTGQSVEESALSLSGTFFTFPAGEPAVVRPGTLIEGSIAQDVSLHVQEGQVLHSEDAQAAPVLIRACLGIYGANLSEFVISIYSDGVRVEGFETGSPAAHSGIQVGDRIAAIRVEGQEYPITSVADLSRVERMLQPDDEVTVLIRNVIRRADIPLTASACYVVP